MELQFSTDNDAFAEGRGEECARILRQIADKCASGYTSGVILDSNGNNVGSWSRDEDEDTEEGEG